MTSVWEDKLHSCFYVFKEEYEVSHRNQLVDWLPQIFALNFPKVSTLFTGEKEQKTSDLEETTINGV